jgi:hypothetical protein
MAKTFFLLGAMAAWLFAGAGLIYLAPAIADNLTHSEMTGLWMQTLNRSGYYPGLATIVSLVLAAVGTGLSVLQPKD